jgi:hypothetical protein
VEVRGGGNFRWWYLEEGSEFIVGVPLKVLPQSSSTSWLLRGEQLLALCIFIKTYYLFTGTNTKEQSDHLVEFLRM